MKYTCPKCNKTIEVSTEALIASEYRIVCPQCLTQLQIVGDYAYVPLDDDSLNLTPRPVEPEPVPEPAPSTTDTAIKPPELPATPSPEPEPEYNTDDPLLNDVIAYLATCNAITPTMISKTFNIDFARAAEIINQLEQRGIVGPYRGGAPRSILIPHNTSLPNAYNYGQPYEPASPDAKPEPSTGKHAQASCTGCFWWLLAMMLFTYLFRACFGG